MRAISKKGLNHSHTEGITINFRNGIFETEKPQEKAILEKYNGMYWDIVSFSTTKLEEIGKDTTQAVKASPGPDMGGLNAKKRHELYSLAKEKGFDKQFIGVTKEELIKFLEKK